MLDWRDMELGAPEIASESTTLRIQRQAPRGWDGPGSLPAGADSGVWQQHMKLFSYLLYERCSCRHRFGQAVF